MYKHLVLEADSESGKSTLICKIIRSIRNDSEVENQVRSFIENKFR